MELTKYSGDERILEKEYLEALLRLKGFKVGQVDEDEDGPVIAAYNPETQVVAIFELNEVNGSWELITYDPVSLAEFNALNIDGLIVWAWDDTGFRQYLSQIVSDVALN